MDLKSTVYRRYLRGPRDPVTKYDVTSGRAPIKTELGLKSVEPLLLKERDQRTRHYLDRGDFAAAEKAAKENGESGLWR